MTKLEVLDLSATNVTNDGVKHLQSLKALKELYLEKTKVTTDGIEVIRGMFPNIVVYPPGIDYPIY